MKMHWLCNDVIGLSQCDACLRNPERPENIGASVDAATQWRKPMANAKGCADQMVPTGKQADANR